MVMLQYLKERGLIKSMISLEYETNIKLAQYGKEISFFRQLIIDGQWEDAENFLKPLKVRQHFNYNRSLYELKRQQFLEDIECCHSDELDIVGLLARAKEVQDKCTKDEFNTLCAYLTLPNLRDHPDFKNWSVEKGRIGCFENILELLKTVYPIESYGKRWNEGRLIELIKQAIKFQCLADGESGVLQDNMNEELQRAILGDRKVAITVEDNKKKFRERDELTESTATMYLAQSKGHQVDHKMQIKRPTTSYSVSFREGFSIDKGVTSSERVSEKRMDSPPKHFTKESKIEEIQNEKGDEDEEAKENDKGGEEIGFEEGRVEYEKTIEEIKPSTSAFHSAAQEEERKQVKIDVKKLSQRAVILDKQPIRACCFSPEGELLAIGTNSMTLKICSLKDVVYSLDDKYQCQLDNTLDLPVVLEQRKYHNGSIYSVDWSHTGRLIATGSNDKTINLLISPFSDPSNANKVLFLKHQT